MQRDPTCEVDPNALTPAPANEAPSPGRAARAHRVTPPNGLSPGRGSMPGPHRERTPDPMTTTTRTAVPRCPGCGCWKAQDLTVCSGCLYIARRAAEQHEGRRCHHCYTPLSEQRPYSRCDDCHSKRTEPNWAYRAKNAARRLPAPTRRLILARLAAGEHLSDVCHALETTPQSLHGFKAYDEQWALQLDDALLAGRDPGLDHGTFNAYRHGRCRCPECREYKLSHSSWAWRRVPQPRASSALAATNADLASGSR